MKNPLNIGELWIGKDNYENVVLKIKERKMMDIEGEAQRAECYQVEEIIDIDGKPGVPLVPPQICVITTEDLIKNYVPVRS